MSRYSFLIEGAEYFIEAVSDSDALKILQSKLDISEEEFSRRFNFNWVKRERNLEFR